MWSLWAFEHSGVSIGWVSTAVYKVLKIAQREYVETAKTKAFILSILAAPIVLGLIITAVTRFTPAPDSSRRALRVGVADFSAKLHDRVESLVAEHNERNAGSSITISYLRAGTDPNAVIGDGKQQLREGDCHVLAVISESALDGAGEVRFHTYNPEAADMQAIWAVESLLRKAIVNYRYEQAGLDPQVMSGLQKVPFERIKLGAEEGEEQPDDMGTRIMQMVAPFFFMWLLFLGTIGATGQHMLSSVLEEKSSRIMEILLSAVTPGQILAGKILGLAGIGLTVTGTWAVIASIATGIQGLSVHVDWGQMVCFAVYYVLGFVLFSSILAGIGSVCNTLKETQSLLMPVMLSFILPFAAWFKIVQVPNGSFARVFSFIPPWVPMMMILRLSSTSDVPDGDVVVSMLILAVATVGTLVISMKIFRVGVLSYGKRPGLREVVRWLK